MVAHPSAGHFLIGERSMDGQVLGITKQFTRRNLLSVTAGFGVLAGSGSGGVLAQQSGSSVVAPRIEPVTTKRRGTGLRGHDPDRALQGFTLFSPLPSSN